MTNLFGIVKQLEKEQDRVRIVVTIECCAQGVRGRVLRLLGWHAHDVGKRSARRLASRRKHAGQSGRLEGHNV